ncbi:MAG TPA: acetyl-CoA carboxylase biotin carboxyl carrier protein [Vicinamibacteria bacterium]
MNLNELKELLELVLEKGITEFELEEKGVRLKIKKGLEPPAQVELVEAKPSNPVAAPLPGPIPSGESLEDAGLTLVRSPMVGTFYRSPEPSAPPFVREGDRVKAGQVLCIIEAMKLMNEIESEEAGEIVRVFVENGQPVQYGDELFALRVSP